MTNISPTSQGLVQPAYTDNWFAKPALPDNLNWAQATQHQQWENNQQSYPNHNPPLPTYPNGAYNTERDSTTSPPITDFDPNETYSWTPIAGGKGWGNPSGQASGATSSSSSSKEEKKGAASGSSVSSAAAAGTTTTGTQGSGSGTGESGQGGAGSAPATSSAAAPEQSGTNEGTEQDDCDEL